MSGFEIVWRNLKELGIFWRYGIIFPKLIALAAGHVCQNLYLACEAIGAGTCAIGAYSQDEMDAILGIDGEEEFTVYVAPVGKIE